MPLFLIYVDISQRLRAIDDHFIDCALNEATMNGCTLCFFLLYLDLNFDFCSIINIYP